MAYSLLLVTLREGMVDFGAAGIFTLRPASALCGRHPLMWFMLTADSMNLLAEPITACFTNVFQ